MPIVVDTVTQLHASAAGKVVVAGSHCGVYAAYLLARARAAGAVLNDAGIGKEGAGIAGLDYLDKLGVPCAAISHLSARIGDGADALMRGVVNRMNEAAATIGCVRGQTARAAAQKMVESARAVHYELPPAIEARHRLELPFDTGIVAWALDSVSLIEADDIEAVIVTGSHGGLLGGREDSALKVDAIAALFNDAGGGIDGAGFTRLPALDRRGIPAATVDAFSARIGDGRSTYDDGVISRVNETAARAGASAGMAAKIFVKRIAARGDRSTRS